MSGGGAGDSTAVLEALLQAGADRVDEDDVGDVEQRIGIVDDREGRPAVVPCIGRMFRYATLARM